MAPLVPKIRNAGDTSQFQDYPESDTVFKMAPVSVHDKDFDEF